MAEPIADGGVALDAYLDTLARVDFGGDPARAKPTMRRSVWFVRTSCPNIAAEIPHFCTGK